MPDKLRVAATLPRASELAVRWLADEHAVVFLLDEETAAYEVLLYDAATGALARWEQADAHRPAARTMPVQCFSRRGELLRAETVWLPPNVSLSPDRGTICWVGAADDWVAVDVRSGAVVRRPRVREDLRTGTAIWLDRGRRWAEPVRAEGYRSIAYLAGYSLDDDRVRRLSVRQLRDGALVGRTVGGTWLFAAPRGSRAIGPRARQVVELARVDLTRRVPRAAVRKVRLPAGWMYTSAILAPCSRRIAWLLWRPPDWAIWLTDLAGQPLTPPSVIDRDELARLAPGAASIRDLDWTPDETALRLTLGGKVMEVAIG